MQAGPVMGSWKFMTASIDDLFNGAKVYLAEPGNSAAQKELEKKLSTFERSCDNLLSSLVASEEALMLAKSDLNQSIKQKETCQKKFEAIETVLKG